MNKIIIAFILFIHVQFGQGVAGIAYLYFTHHQLELEIQSQLQAYSVIYLELDDVCWLRLQLGLLAGIPKCDLFMWPCLPHNIMSGCQGYGLKREPDGSYVTFCELALKVRQHHFCYILLVEVSKQLTSFQAKKQTSLLDGVVARFWKTMDWNYCCDNVRKIQSAIV